MTDQTHPADGLARTDRKRPDAAGTGGAPEGEERSRLDMPPPGGDAARNEERKTPPDRNRGRTVDAP